MPGDHNLNTTTVTHSQELREQHLPCSLGEKNGITLSPLQSERPQPIVCVCVLMCNQAQKYLESDVFLTFVSIHHHNGFEIKPSRCD